MNVLVTGSSGAVGTAVVDRFEADGHDVTCVDRVEHPGHDTQVVDLRDYDAVQPLFEGQDVVVHAAQNPSLNWRTTTVSWSPSLVDNLQLTTNVVHAAVEADVEMIVHCSTNHVVGGYEERVGDDLYEPDDVRIDHETPPRPDSLYAVEKLYEEALIRFVAGSEVQSGYSIRIGYVRPAGEDTPYGSAENAVSRGEIERESEEYDRWVRRGKGIWLSRRDAGQLFVRCAETDVDGFELFYGVSDNDRRWLAIERAREVVGYDPVDNGERCDPPGVE